MTMGNKNSLRILYVVQLITIIILVLLLIQDTLPYFGITPPVGGSQRIIVTPPPGGYIRPSKQQIRGFDGASLTLALSPQHIVHSALEK
jgi:hypothetical protein